MPLAEPLARDRARGDAHGGLARRLPAAAAVIADAVFVPIGVIGVPGPERVGDARVVLAARVLVADQKRDRRAGRDAFEHAGEDFDRVRLPALRHMARGPGLAPVEVALDVGRISARPGGQPSTTQPIAGPCDSPNDVTQKSLPNVLPDIGMRRKNRGDYSTR